MPAAHQLPPDLEALATLNAVELSNAHWDEDVARLTDHIREGLYTLGVDRAARARIAPDFFPMPRMENSLKSIINVATGFGLAFAAVGIFIGVQQLRMEVRSLAVNAEVTYIEEGRNDRGARTYRPEFQYLTKSGQTARGRGPKRLQSPLQGRPDGINSV